MIYVFVYTSRAEQSLPRAWSAQLVYFIAEAAIGAWLLLGAVGSCATCALGAQPSQLTSQMHS